MNTLRTLCVGAVPLLATSAALAQNGNMWAAPGAAAGWAATAGYGCRFWWSPWLSALS